MKKTFQFKKFSLAQGDAAMAISTDGVLLGAWAQFEFSQQLLDIGCGTGLLSLMLAQRYPNASICALDIDEKAIQVAKHNLFHSPFHEQVSIVHTDIAATKFADKYQQTFDGIICNPPYFDNGPIAPNNARAMARHTVSLSHQTLMLNCAKLLKDNGTLCLIIPADQQHKLINFAHQYGLHLTHCTEVKATEHKPISRALLKFNKPALKSQPLKSDRLNNSPPEPLPAHRQTVEKVQRTELSIMNKGRYSDEFCQLTNAFYLKM